MATLTGRFGGHDFVRLWAAAAVSDFGTAVTTVVLPLVALVSLHASTFQVGLITAAGLASWLLFGLVAGVWVERVRRRPLMIACDAARALVLASIPAAAAFHVLHLVQVVVCALVVGVLSVFFDVASQTYLPAVVPAEELLASNAKLQGSDAAGRTAGPALGGVLVQLLGAPLVLLVDVGSYLFSLWSLTTVRATEPAPAPEPGGRPLRRIGEGVRFVLRDPVLGPITIVATSLNLVEAAFMALQIPFLLRTLSAPPALVGVVLAVGGIGGVAGAGLGARLGARAGTPRALLVAACLAPLFALLFPASFAGAGLVLFGIGVLGREICITMFSLLARSYRQASTPNRLLARVTATVKFLSWGMLPVGSLVGGLLGQTLGNRAALWLIAGVAVLTPLPMLVPPRRGSAVPAGDRVAEQAD